MCGSGRDMGKGCIYRLVGSGIGMSDGICWLSSSSGGIKVGAGTGSFVALLGVGYELKATVCSILGDPVMCSMTAIEHLACVAPLDE